MLHVLHAQTRCLRLLSRTVNARDAGWRSLHVHVRHSRNDVWAHANRLVVAGHHSRVHLGLGMMLDHLHRRLRDSLVAHLVQVLLPLQKAKEVWRSLHRLGWKSPHRHELGVELT